jgi:hypothetical protein
MVTPSYKEGYPLLLSGNISADGSKAIVSGLSAIAETQGAGEEVLQGDAYVDERRSDGWVLSPLNAPLSEFVGQRPLAYEADSGASLWNQHTPSQSGQTRGLYSRSGAGVYNYLGPLNVPFEGEETEPGNWMEGFEKHYDQPIAATSDYGHVIVYARRSEDFWKEIDETQGQQSIYEYSGTNNSRPILVGVNGSTKGTHNLVGRCGTLLGSGSSSSKSQPGSLFNALSSDGETVFFTAEACPSGPAVAEVFARRHGALVAPGTAETVDVSASECSEACGAGKSGAEFEGASEDGRIVYLTSTQKLTNDAVDGTSGGGASAAEGGDCALIPEGPSPGGCNLYMYDFNLQGPECQAAHHCLRLVAGGEVLGVAGIAGDGHRIYYVRRMAGAPDLYVYDVDTGESRLVATLSYTGEEEEETIWQREYRRPVEVSGEDGRYLIFVSRTPQLTTDDHAVNSQLFEYDAVTGELVRISKGEDGYNENGNAVKVGVTPESIAGVSEALGDKSDFKSGVDRLNISFDGRTVVFKTRGRLSPFASSAEQNCASVYEFRTPGLLSEGSVHLISDGADAQFRKGLCGAGFEFMDATGNNILFSTDDALLPTDVDGGQQDVYDARVEGGLPLPSSVLCADAECGVPGPSGVSTFDWEGSALEAPETMPVASTNKHQAVKARKKPKGRPKKVRKTKHRRIKGRSISGGGGRSR